MWNQGINKIIQGDCLIKLKELEDNSVDSIVTDPPYELGFMGKSWDNTGIANNVELWKECLRVLKPGGHLLAFSGTRTYHRMASAIEDAGFEVRDMIEWVYGCLSEDTEILTESGYKPLHKLTQYDRIGVYDITNNIYKWERPQRYSIYKVHQDTAYRIKSDYTDQIVSRNHRCIVEREGKLVFIQADELNEVEYMPTLSDDFYTLQEGHRKLLLKELLRKGKGLAQKLFSKWTGKEMSSERIEVRKEPSLERWSNLLEETRKLQADKICEMSEGVFTDGEKRWICNGTSFDNCSVLGDMFRENPSSASYQSRPTGQPTGKPDAISNKQGTQITRRARVTKIEYSGIIFCPTVSTGAFVARRNGQVFITGNSGFPKSLNIGKAVDKLQGNEREEMVNKRWAEKYPNGPGGNLNPEKYSQCKRIVGNPLMTTKGTSEWEGWGTALKPAHEPICLARKPISEKTVAENCLKYGTGGINIDESRVGTEVRENPQYGNGGDLLAISKGGEQKWDGTKEIVTGRFPANLIHDNSEEVRECFPESKSAGGLTKNVPDSAGVYGKYGVVETMKPTDSGNASRFFKSIIYQAKASKSERNRGLDDFEEVEVRGGGGRVEDGYDLSDPEQVALRRAATAYGAVKAKKANIHPTVKPIALMEYLIKMVTPRGGIVLDPFAGSGSTLVAAKQNGFSFVGIELTEEYIPIIEARLNAVLPTLL